MDIFNVLGKFHVLILHFPIGILILVAFLEIISHFYKKSDWRQKTHFLLLWGIVAAVFTAYCGWLLAGRGDYDPKLIFWHKWLGFSTVAFALLLWFYKNTKWYLPMLGTCVALLLAAGHYGGSLTHGENYLTEPFFPTPIFSSITINKMGAHENIYKALIAPILQKKCVSCHNSSKSKGKLRLDSQEQILIGGEHGAVIVPKNAEQSELYRRAILPMNDDRHMPPRVQMQLTPDELSLLKWWINDGADFQKKMETAVYTDDLANLKYLFGK
jgi:predicted CXXCH cytochrome family protein